MINPGASRGEGGDVNAAINTLIAGAGIALEELRLAA